MVEHGAVGLEAAGRDQQRPAPHQPAAAGGWLDESQRRLGEDLAARLDLAAVAAAVGMGYESWRKRFQAALGLPPARYRLHRRVVAAQELMRHTSLPGREIARLVGFSDEYHLSKRSAGSPA
ncbi:helix-turn-helix domain-containing protein [Actinophytocola sp.]|uniref:helix-turn-helix domain-containing protein n=1 Tax=Actinophytocola sp. TaxID=1872138 RepID=UPI003D6B260F